MFRSHGVPDTPDAIHSSQPESGPDGAGGDWFYM